MSIQSEINRLKQNVSAAFTAIGNKGGTVPSSKVSGNLATAIQSIPEGVTIQRKAGSFTTNNNGIATVDCGFQPDILVFPGFYCQYYGDEYEIMAAIAFPERETNRQYLTGVGVNDEYSSINFQCFRSDTGFTVRMTRVDWATRPEMAVGYTANYIAIKYTE